MTNHKFIFVGGLHRSGKSLLYNCLKEHPLISGFRDNAAYQDEGQHAQSVYELAKFYGGQGRFGFNPEAHLTEESSLVTDENRIKLFSEWQRYWDMGKPYLLEQSPPNLIRTRFLQEMFPDSYFIIILRHPIPVSYETQRCMGDDRATIDYLIKHWLICHEIFNSDKGYLNNLFVLQYEKFVKAPDENIKKICSFLGIENFANTLTVSSDINRKYFDKWQQCEKNILTKPYIYLLRKIFEKRVNRFGYSLYDLDTISTE